jgi:hypothetical protein
MLNNFTMPQKVGASCRRVRNAKRNPARPAFDPARGAPTSITCICEQVVVVLAPLAGWARGRGALQDDGIRSGQLSFEKPTNPIFDRRARETVAAE